MRNLFNILWKYQFFIAFLFLQAISLTLLFQYNKFHKAEVLTGAAQISGSTYLFVNNIQSYLSLKEENEKLRLENEHLKNRSKADAYYSLDTSKTYFNDSLFQRQYKFLSARVINSTVGNRNNYITLNHGEFSGVAPEMGIITEKGVAGIIKDVSSHFSVGLSLLHSKTKLSVRLKNSNYFGLVSWDGVNPYALNLDDIPNHVNIQVGDTIVTSGASSIFPYGLLVGTIISFEKVEGEVFYKIKIKPTQDLNSTSSCYIVMNRLKHEQVELETTAQADED